MGIGCCNCKEKPKENEVILPKIKYNLHEINRIAKMNSNNDNIMTNTNEQDVISRSSHGYELEKKFDSIENSPNNNNKQQNNNSSSKYQSLGQINEKEQKYEQDQDDNSNNKDFSQIDKINVNHLINNVDKLCKQHISNSKNSIRKEELKEMNKMKFVSKNMDKYDKMNQYNIDNESQNKIRGDYNTNNNFENSNEEYQIESKNDDNKIYNINNESLNNSNILQTKNQNLDEENKENNDDILQIEVNDIVNSDNKNINKKDEDEYKPKNNEINDDKYEQNEENKDNKDINNNNINRDSLEKNDFQKNTNKLKNSFNSLSGLDDYPLIDDDNNNINNNEIIASNKKENDSLNRIGEKYIDDKNDFFSNGMNKSNDNSLSEIEKKEYEGSLNGENKTNPSKKRNKKLSEENDKKENNN